MYRFARQFTILSAIACVGGIPSLVEASGEWRKECEERVEEESNGRGQRYGSRWTAADIQAWQQEEHRWRAPSSNATEQLHDWETVEISPAHLLGQDTFDRSTIDIASVVSSEFNDSRDKGNDYTASDRKTSMNTDMMPEPSFRPTLDSDNSTIALQHSGGMDFQMPVIDETGQVSGGGGDETSVQSVRSKRNHSVAMSEVASEDGVSQSSVKTSGSNVQSSSMSTSDQTFVDDFKTECDFVSDAHESDQAMTKQRKVERQSTIPASRSSAPTVSKALESEPISPHLDQQILEIRHQIKQDRRTMYGGIAAAMAMPHVTPSAGKRAIAVGGAHFQGQSAVGIGAAWRSISGETHVNVAMGVSAAAVGVKMQVAREF